ncbi:MAG: hypothetical protein ACKVE4_10425 [Dissulfuribacterales bacterium]
MFRWLFMLLFLRSSQKKNTLGASGDSLVGTMSDLDILSVMGSDSRCNNSADMLITQKQMAYLAVGLKIGIAEIILLPLLIPLAVGIIQGYIPLVGNWHVGWQGKAYALVLVLWTSIMVNFVIHKKIAKGAGNLWLTGMRRFLQGRTIAIIIGTLITFVVLQLCFSMSDPVGITDKFVWIMDWFSDNPYKYQEPLLYILRAIHGNLRFSAVLALGTGIISMLIPWITFYGRIIKIEKSAEELQQILQ